MKQTDDLPIMFDLVKAQAESQRDAFGVDVDNLGRIEEDGSLLIDLGFEAPYGVLALLLLKDILDGDKVELLVHCKLDVGALVSAHSIPQRAGEW